MNAKHYEQMWRALNQIRNFQSPAQLKKFSRVDFGLDGDEALEMAYENVIEIAKRGLKRVRHPTVISSHMPASERE